jgi:hypothetical protein
VGERAIPFSSSDFFFFSRSLLRIHSFLPASPLSRTGFAESAPFNPSPLPTGRASAESVTHWPPVALLWLRCTSVEFAPSNLARHPLAIRGCDDTLIAAPPPATGPPATLTSFTSLRDKSLKH